MISRAIRCVGNTFSEILININHPLLLVMILKRATGVPVADYLEHKIWEPIGTEFPISKCLDERGFERMESGINARAIDYAKFGRLNLIMAAGKMCRGFLKSGLFLPLFRDDQ